MNPLMTRRQSLEIPQAPRCCEGHFPSNPVLPAVALLDAVLHALEPLAGMRLTVTAAKFLTPVRPGQPLELQHEAAPGGALRFTVAHEGTPVASGVLQSASQESASQHSTSQQIQQAERPGP